MNRKTDQLNNPQTPKSVGVVIEFKVVNSIKKETLETALSSARIQIEEKQYTTELLAMGSSKVYQYAMAFYGKTVKVALGS